jgi:hypothetical protein
MPNLRPLSIRSVAIAPAAEMQRCSCPECRRLDREFPSEGYQLALFPYRLGLPMKRR